MKGTTDECSLWEVADDYLSIDFDRPTQWSSALVHTVCTALIRMARTHIHVTDRIYNATRQLGKGGYISDEELILRRYDSPESAVWVRITKDDVSETVYVGFYETASFSLLHRPVGITTKDDWVFDFYEEALADRAVSELSFFVPTRNWHDITEDAASIAHVGIM